MLRFVQQAGQAKRIGKFKQIKFPSLSWGALVVVLQQAPYMFVSAHVMSKSDSCDLAFLASSYTAEHFSDSSPPILRESDIDE